MKIKTNKHLSIMKAVLIIVYSIFFLGGCLNTLEGTIGASLDRGEAMRRKVYICDLINKNNSIVFSGEEIQIESAWLEKQWRYGKDADSTLVTASDKGYQLIIRFASNYELSDYKEQWFIGVDHENSFRQLSPQSLICDLSCILSDTISFPIQDKRVLSPNKKKNVIGDLSLWFSTSCKIILPLKPGKNHYEI